MEDKFKVGDVLVWNEDTVMDAWKVQFGKRFVVVHMDGHNPQVEPLDSHTYENSPWYLFGLRKDPFLTAVRRSKRDTGK